MTSKCLLIGPGRLGQCLRDLDMDVRKRRTQIMRQRVGERAMFLHERFDAIEHRVERQLEPVDRIGAAIDIRTAREIARRHMFANGGNRANHAIHLADEEQTPHQADRYGKSESGK
jgi:hypothetical protein